MPLCAIIAVTEVDGAVLVAVPETMWDHSKAKRVLPPDALRKAVRVLVPGCIDEDRTTPESSPSFKVWLGILRETLETSVLYGEDVGEDLGYGFPVDALGIQKLPFAKALVAIEGGSAPGAPEVERRMTALEEMMREMRDGSGSSASSLAQQLPPKRLQSCRLLQLQLADCLREWIPAWPDKP